MKNYYFKQKLSYFKYIPKKLYSQVLAPNSQLDLLVGENGFSYLILAIYCSLLLVAEKTHHNHKYSVST